VNSVGRRQMKVRITHAPVAAGRNPKRFSESTSERLQRTVVGVQRNVRDRHSGMRQLIGCSFQQEPSSHGCRSFFHHSSKQPVELRAALIRLARQILRFRRRIQRARDNSRQAVCRILTIRFIHAFGSSSGRNHRQKMASPPDRMYQSCLERSFEECNSRPGPQSFITRIVRDRGTLTLGLFRDARQEQRGSGESQLSAHFSGAIRFYRRVLANGRGAPHKTKQNSFRISG